MPKNADEMSMYIRQSTNTVSLRIPSLSRKGKFVSRDAKTSTRDEYAPRILLCGRLLTIGVVAGFTEPGYSFTR
jgi:hypothetical protein